MMGLSTLIGFFAGYAALMAMLLRRRGPVEAIAALIATYVVLSTEPSELLTSVRNLADWGNARVIVFIFMSLFLAGVLRETGRLDDIVKYTGSIGCRFSLVSVPAIIGLLPMPGGALVSAIAMRDKYFKEAKLTPEWATFLNYWFRHVWVPSWPLFQSVVLTAAVLHVDPSDVIRVTWPATFVAIGAGLAVSGRVLARTSCPQHERTGISQGIWGLLPFVLLAVLVFGAGWGLMESLLATIALSLVAYRPSPSQLKGALKLATRPKVHAVLVEALLLKELLINTGAPLDFVEAAKGLGLPLWAIAALTPFVLGLAAGGENFFAATAIPLLAPHLIDPKMLLLAYGSGFVGVLASPVHLCYALTVEYYKADTAKSLAIVLAAVALSITLILLLFFL
jgi:hypothetical protein